MKATSGFDALDRKLAALAKELSRDEAKSVLLPAVKIIGDEKRRLIPVMTGRGRASIKEVMLDADGSNDPTAAVGPMEGEGYDPFYLIFPEYGTAYVPATPFARPAVELKGEAAQQQVRRGLQRVMRSRLK